MFYEMADEDDACFPGLSAERSVDPDMLVENAVRFRKQESQMRRRIELIKIDGLKKVISDRFYLRGCPIPLRAYEGKPLPTGTRFVSITGLSGSGKHDIQAKIAETIAQQEHHQKVIVGRTPNMNVPDIKAQYQTNIPGDQLRPEWIRLSMIGYSNFLQEVRQSNSDHVISYRGPVGVWNSLMLHFGEADFASLFTRPSKSRSIWEAPSLAELASSEPDLVDQTWGVMLRALQKGQKENTFSISAWPMVSQASPTIMISNLSPEQCWRLQELPSPNRQEVRPFGQHPFTQIQMKIMRLIHTALVRDLDFVKAFGGFDPEYANGGASRIALELMQKSYQLYRRFKA